MQGSIGDNSNSFQVQLKQELKWKLEASQGLEKQFLSQNRPLLTLK